MANQDQTDTLFNDTTNFFIYIDTTNTNCDIAQRGKNKQHRMKALDIENAHNEQPKIKHVSVFK